MVWNKDYVKLHRKAEQSLIWKGIKRFMAMRHASYFSMVETYNWRWGTDNILDTVEVSQQFKLDPAEINCPLLNIYSEQELMESEAFQSFAKKARIKLNILAQKLLRCPKMKGLTVMLSGQISA